MPRQLPPRAHAGWQQQRWEMSRHPHPGGRETPNPAWLGGTSRLQKGSFPITPQTETSLGTSPLAFPHQPMLGSGGKCQLCQGA